MTLIHTCHASTRATLANCCCIKRRRGGVGFGKGSQDRSVGQLNSEPDWPRFGQVSALLVQSVVTWHSSHSESCGSRSSGTGLGRVEPVTRVPTGQDAPKPIPRAPRARRPLVDAPHHCVFPTACHGQQHCVWERKTTSR